MIHQTIEQAKKSLINDIEKLLENNIKDLKINNYKIHSKTRIGKDEEMFDDLVNQKIHSKYMPITYDDLIEWTKQEPLLIEKPIYPCFYDEESGILAILRSNIGNYLKRYVYKWVKHWSLKKQGSY